jgi:hypothetical protein
MIMTDGKKTYCTPVVEVENTAPGKVGLWLYQIGERQEYGDFKVSRAEFAPVRREIKGWPVEAAAGEAVREAKELPLVLHENPGILPALKIPEVTFLPGEDYKPPPSGQCMQGRKQVQLVEILQGRCIAENLTQGAPPPSVPLR